MKPEQVLGIRFTSYLCGNCGSRLVRVHQDATNPKPTECHGCGTEVDW